MVALKLKDDEKKLENMIKIPGREAKARSLTSLKLESPIKKLVSERNK